DRHVLKAQIADCVGKSTRFRDKESLVLHRRGLQRDPCRSEPPHPTADAGFCVHALDWRLRVCPVSAFEWWLWRTDARGTSVCAVADIRVCITLADLGRGTGQPVSLLRPL